VLCGDHVRRAWSVPLLLALALMLAAPPAASAKFAIESAEVCGADECRTVTDEDTSYLPFELLAPLIESDRTSAERTGAASESRFQITLNLNPANTVRVDYLPETQRVRVVGGDGALEFRGRDQVSLNGRWIALSSKRPGITGARAEAQVWAGLADGLAPIPAQVPEPEPRASTGPSSSSGLIIAIGIAAVLGLLAAAGPLRRHLNPERRAT
jgi:hypothetical protein